MQTISQDNIFLIAISKLKSRREKLSTGLVLQTIFSLFVFALVLFWAVAIVFSYSTKQQVNMVGMALLEQTSVTAKGYLIANDTISLSVMTASLGENPLVSYVSIHSMDNQLIAEGGSQKKLDNGSSGYFVHTIATGETALGQIRMRLDIGQLREPMIHSLQILALLSVFFISLAGALCISKARNLALLMTQIRLWLMNTDQPIPGGTRVDEIGALACALERFARPAESKESEPKHILEE